MYIYTVTQDIFASASPSLISSTILRAIYSHQDNHRVIEAAFNACKLYVYICINVHINNHTYMIMFVHICISNNEF
jgi:hypothetical protein